MPHRYVLPARLLIFCTLLLSATPLVAQETEGVIVGRVLGEGGEPLLAATVRVSGAGGFLRRIRTDEDGVFRAFALPAGTYDLTARHLGYREATLRDVTVGVGETEEVTITLDLAPVELEGVDVVFTPVTIDPVSTEFATDLAEAEIELLPVSRDASDLVAFTPGARVGHVWGGATAQANSYELDGLPVNHPGVGGDVIQPSVNWIESVEVRGLGAGAEYGGFQGGLINVVTKSGTNEFQGELRTSYDTHHLNSSNLVPTEIGSEVAGYSDIEGEIRGPILRDRLFYYLAGQLLRRDTRFTNHLPGLEAAFSPALMERRESKFFGKLTWWATSKDIVESSFGRIGTDVGHFGSTGYEDPDATLDMEARTLFYNLSWQRIWSARNVLNLKVAGFSLDETRSPYARPDAPGMHIFGLTGLSAPTPAYNNAPLRYRHAPESVSGEVIWSLGLRTGELEHQLELGAQHSMGSFLDQRLRNGGMTWRPTRRLSVDPDDPTTWPFSSAEFIPVTYGGEVNLDAEVENSALFAQSTIILHPRVTISPGIRFGRWVGRLTPVGGETFTAVEDQAFDPRIGVTLDILGDNSFVAKAHWGRYHQGMISQFFDRVESGDVFTNEQVWFYRGEPFQDPMTRFTVEERDRLAEDGVFTLQSEIVLNETGPVVDYDQPYVDQWIVGLEKTLGSSMKIEAVYVNRRNRQMVALVDRNAATNYTTYEYVDVLDASGVPIGFDGGNTSLRRVHVPNNVLIERLQCIARGPCQGTGALMPPGLTFADTLTLTWDPDFVLTNAPGARREFDQFQFTGEISRPTWGVTASLVFTDLVGNLDNVSGYEDPSGYGAGPYVRVNEGVNAFGKLPNFSERELKIALFGDLPWKLRGGMFWTHSIGDHFSPRFILSGIGSYRYRLDNGPELDSKFFAPMEGHRVFVGPRGAPRYRNRLLVDVHLEREFPAFGGGWTVSLDLFNIFNTATVTQRNTSVNHGRDFYYFLPDRPTDFGAVDPNQYYKAPLERVPPRTLRLGMVFRF